eukprot:2766211-Pleurochrysis_carterae.AAC.1
MAPRAARDGLGHLLHLRSSCTHGLEGARTPSAFDAAAHCSLHREINVFLTNKRLTTHHGARLWSIA